MRGFFLLLVVIFLKQRWINAFLPPTSAVYRVVSKNDDMFSISFKVSQRRNKKQQLLSWALWAFWEKEESVEPSVIVTPPPPPPSVSSMAVMRRSLPVYVFLLALNIFTFLDLDGLATNAIAATMSTVSFEQSSTVVSSIVNNARTVFFGSSAMLTAYLGAERQDIAQTQAPLTSKNAVTAPVIAGGTLFVLYLIIQYTKLDPGILYRAFTSFFGFICLTEISAPLLALSPLGIVLTKQMVKLSLLGIEQQQSEKDGMYFTPPEGETQSDILTLQACELPAAVISISVVIAYWLGVSDTEAMTTSLGNLRSVAFTNNYIAASIGLVTLGQIAVESYVAGSALLSGLFFYDALSVFKSDAMLTVATKIEAPVKLLFASNVIPPEGKYPFGVLGLGDIVIPGIFLAMLRQFDIEKWYSKNMNKLSRSKKNTNPLMNTKKNVNRKKIDEALMISALSSPQPSLDLYQSADTPYFKSGLASYLIGLGLTFAVLAVTGQGQPALFYIVPSLLIGSSLTALVREELSELWTFKGARSAAASKARKDAIEKQNREKQESEENIHSLR